MWEISQAMPSVCCAPLLLCSLVVDVMILPCCFLGMTYALWFLHSSSFLWRLPWSCRQGLQFLKSVGHFTRLTPAYNHIAPVLSNLVFCLRGVTIEMVRWAMQARQWAQPMSYNTWIIICTCLHFFYYLKKTLNTCVTWIYSIVCVCPASITVVGLSLHLA